MCILVEKSPELLKLITFFFSFIKMYYNKIGVVQCWKFNIVVEIVCHSNKNLEKEL